MRSTFISVFAYHLKNNRIIAGVSGALKKGLCVLCLIIFAISASRAQAPQITPKVAVRLQLDETGHKTVAFTDVADITGLAANGTVSVNPLHIDCSLLGPQTITVTASNGTPATTQTKSIPVIVTSTPVFSDHHDITIPADNNCNTVLPDYTAMYAPHDICNNATLSIKQDPLAGTPLIVNQPTNITITASDQFGGITAIFFTVTSYAIPVIFPKPGPITLKLSESGSYEVQVADLGSPFVCDGSTLTNTMSPLDLNCANLGNQTITLTSSNLRPNPQAVTFSVPADAVTDAAGNIYVADSYSCSIRKIATNGTVTTFAGGSGCGYADGSGATAKFKVVNGITIDPSGNLYVIDENDRVRKITPNGTVTTIAGNGQNKTVDGLGTAASFQDPKGITIDAGGNLYITQGDYRIRKVTPGGMVITITPPSSVSKLNSPIGITTDPLGNLYITDYSSAIKKIAPDGTITTVAGHDGSGFTDGTGAAASFNQPKGIIRDNQGNLYVTDSKNNAIRKIDPSGKVTTLQLYTNNPVDKATLNNPIGIKLDPFGNLIVVDTDNERIVRITPAGQLTTIAGNGIVGNNNGNTNTPAMLGGTASINVPVTVLSSINSTSPQGGIVSTISSLPADATVCAGKAIDFTASIPPGTTVNSYQWQVNGVNAGTNQSTFSSSALQNGDLVTCITANNVSCTVPQTSQPIQAHINPAPGIVFAQNPTIKLGENITLVPQLSGDIVSLSWSPALGLSSTNTPYPIANPAVTTIYYLTATSSLNCQSIVPVTVTVITPIHIPNTFTPNGDGFNDVWKIDDLVNYPNCTVNIFNRYGQALFHANGYGTPWDGTYHGGKLPPGTYYYIIDLKNGNKPLAGWVAIIR
ncbi:gliding motility-associated C-terminal domain-containing protein [Mucilaginibacter sp. OK268]|uniref:T9SS type B sorting domain-containing protein n=1 Tax=Mucilaginibacter sp. OK268 TaxID=1881048 RepID=UPI0015A17BE0|nr:gliding motility-associated C-terminal domain-containing protein [Mucilaginibacter sp. OK268]